MIRCTHPTACPSYTLHASRRVLGPESSERKEKKKEKISTKSADEPPSRALLSSKLARRFPGAGSWKFSKFSKFSTETLTCFFPANGSGRRLSGVSGSLRSLIGHSAVLSIMYLHYHMIPIRSIRYDWRRLLNSDDR